jgi:hypothetical protein
VKKTPTKIVQLRLNEAYRWQLIPTQHVTNGSVGAIEWDFTQATGIRLAVRWGRDAALCAGGAIK